MPQTRQHISGERPLRGFYRNLPADKTIRYGALEKWPEALPQHNYTIGSVNAFVSAANSYLDYIGHREYQLAGQLKGEKPPQSELSRAEHLYLLQTAKALGTEKVYLLATMSLSWWSRPWSACWGRSSSPSGGRSRADE